MIGRTSSFFSTIHDDVVMFIAETDIAGNSDQPGRDHHVRPRRKWNVAATTHQDPLVAVAVPVVGGDTVQILILTEHAAGQEFARVDNGKGGDARAFPFLLIWAGH